MNNVRRLRHGAELLQPNPMIHGIAKPVSASNIVNAIGESLDAIRREDRLTFKDLGGLLGKSADAVTNYCDATAGMDAATFIRCCSLWNGRFANSILALINQHLAPNANITAVNMAGLIDLTQLLLQLQFALEDDDLSDDEVAAMRPFIEAAGAIVDTLRARLSRMDAQ